MRKKGIRIRRAEEKDAALLAKLDGSMFPGSPWGEEAFLSSVSSENECCLIACGAEDRDDGLFGYVLFSCIIDAEIYRIGVTESMRGLGIGRELLCEAEACCMRQGASRMFLEVRDDNLPALSLYVSAGFCEIYRRRGYYDAGGSDALVMEKIIGKEA